MPAGPGSATNWQPPGYRPQTGHFYVGMSEALRMSYLTDTDERPEGYGFTGGGGGGDGAQHFIAFGAETGKPLWHTALPANRSNGPETDPLDGKQFVLLGRGICFTRSR